MKNSAIKQGNIVQISNFLIPKKSANKQQNSANKHAEHWYHGRQRLAGAGYSASRNLFVFPQM